MGGRNALSCLERAGASISGHLNIRRNDTINRKGQSHGNYRTDSHAAAVSADEGPEQGLYSLLPPGRFLRNVQRGCKARCPGVGSDPNQPGPVEAQRGADPHVRRTLPQRRLLYRPTGAKGLQGSHLRANGGPRHGQGPGRAGHHPNHHPRHGDGKLHAGRVQE